MASPLLAVLLLGCNSPLPPAGAVHLAHPPAGKTVGVHVQMAADAGQVDSLIVWDVAGVDQHRLAAVAATRNADGTAAKLMVQLAAPGLYTLQLGSGENARRLPLLLGEDETVQVAVAADGSVRYPNSPGNQQYQAFLRAYQQSQQQVTAAASQLRATAPDAGLQQALSTRIDSLLREQSQVTAQFAAQPGLTGRLARLYWVVPFEQLPAQHGYRDMNDYFTRGFFANDSLGDPSLGYLPPLFEKSQAYASLLLDQLQMSSDSAFAVLGRVLTRTPAGSRSRQIMLQAFMGVAEGSDPDLFMRLAERYVQAYPQHRLSAQLGPLAKAYLATRVGSPAPDIRLPGPDGKPRALADLRGKYVLVDFWASWCGPCRRENPNVVALYQRYKGKNFEIFGVSLDRDRQAWLQAIAQDGLPWWHVSDLQYWNSAGAQTYQVRSIPYTVLVGPDGTILAKNLRGPELEAKLAALLDG